MVFSVQARHLVADERWRAGETACCRGTHQAAARRCQEALVSGLSLTAGQFRGHAGFLRMPPFFLLSVTTPETKALLHEKSANGNAGYTGLWDLSPKMIELISFICKSGEKQKVSIKFVALVGQWILPRVC